MTRPGIPGLGLNLGGKGKGQEEFGGKGMLNEGTKRHR